jgi:hypothetical protein
MPTRTKEQNEANTATRLRRQKEKDSKEKKAKRVQSSTKSRKKKQQQENELKQPPLKMSMSTPKKLPTKAGRPRMSPGSAPKFEDSLQRQCNSDMAAYEGLENVFNNMRNIRDDFTEQEENYRDYLADDALIEDGTTSPVPSIDGPPEEEDSKTPAAVSMPSGTTGLLGAADHQPPPPFGSASGTASGAAAPVPAPSTGLWGAATLAPVAAPVTDPVGLASVSASVAAQPVPAPSTGFWGATTLTPVAAPVAASIGLASVAACVAAQPVAVPFGVAPHVAAAPVAAPSSLGGSLTFALGGNATFGSAPPVATAPIVAQSSLGGSLTFAVGRNAAFGSALRQFFADFVQLYLISAEQQLKTPCLVVRWRYL